MLCFAGAVIVVAGIIWREWKKSKEVPSVHRLIQKWEPVNTKAPSIQDFRNMVVNCKNAIHYTHHCEHIDFNDPEHVGLVKDVRHLAMDVQLSALKELGKLAEQAISEPFRVGYINHATLKYEEFYRHLSALLATIEPGEELFAIE